MGTPFFSIIVVSLNAEATIKKTIESILSQSFTDFEIIVKDGCSHDNTVKEIPPSDKIQVIVKPDNSIYDAMNQAIGLSSGEYICFMNCGDTFSDDNVLKTIYDKAITQSGRCNVIYSDYQRKNVIARMPLKLYDFYLFRTPLNHQTLYIGKDVFVKYGLYNLDYKILADYEHTLRTYRSGVPYIYCNVISCNYLGNGISESEKGVIIKNQEYARIRSQYFSKKQLLKYKLLIFLSLKSLREKMASDKSPLYIRKKYRNIVNIINRF